MLGDLTTQFVSLPSLKETCPSPHLTGGSVDLTICDEGRNPIWMGTTFDDFTELAHTRYFEDKLARGEHLTAEETVALNNRRMLYWTMKATGFTNYSCEWWHYDYGNQFWGVVEGKPAIYGLSINMI